MIHFKIYDFKVTKCFEHMIKYNMIFSYQEMFMLRLGKKFLSSHFISIKLIVGNMFFLIKKGLLAVGSSLIFTRRLELR